MFAAAIGFVLVVVSCAEAQTSAGEAHPCSGLTGPQCVQQCYNRETEQLRTQTERDSNLGFWSTLGSVATSLMPGPASEIFEGVKAVALTGQERAHELANIRADNCEQMHAAVSLGKLNTVENSLDQTDLKIDVVFHNSDAIRARLVTHQIEMRALSDSMRATIDAEFTDMRTLLTTATNELSNQLTATFAQGKSTQEQVRKLERNMDEHVRQVAQTQAMLAHKIDIVSSQVLENRRLLDENHYSTMSVEFASSIAMVSGAFQDFLNIQKELQASSHRLATMEMSKTSVTRWALDRQDLRKEMRIRVSDCSQRARDGLVKSLATVIDGNFLAKHYELQMLSLTVAWLEKNASCAAAFTGGGPDALVDEIRNKLLGEDQVLQLAFVAVLQYQAVASFSSRVFGTEDIYLPPTLQPAIAMFESVKMQFMSVSETTKRIEDSLKVASRHVCELSTDCKAAAVTQNIDTLDFVQVAMNGGAQVYFERSPESHFSGPAAESDLYLCDRRPQFTPALSRVFPSPVACTPTEKGTQSHAVGLVEEDRKSPGRPHMGHDPEQAVRRRRTTTTAAPVCMDVTVGGSATNSKVVSVPAEFQCPGRVDSSNWLGHQTYGDWFTVTPNPSDATSRVVKRSDSYGGWGMILKMECCIATTTTTTTPLAVEVTCPEHYAPRFRAASAGTGRTANVELHCAEFNLGDFGYDGYDEALAPVLAPYTKYQNIWATKDDLWHMQGPPTSDRYVYEEDGEAATIAKWGQPNDCELLPDEPSVFMKQCPYASDLIYRPLARCLWSGAADVRVTKALVNGSEQWVQMVNLMKKVAEYEGHL